MFSKSLLLTLLTLASIQCGLDHVGKWVVMYGDLQNQPLYFNMDIVIPRATLYGKNALIAMFDVLALANQDEFTPYLCHPEWDYMRFCGGNHGCSVTDNKVILAQNYAAYRVARLFFQDSDSLTLLNNFMHVTLGISSISNSYDINTPEGIGNTIGNYTYHYSILTDNTNWDGKLSGTATTGTVNYTTWTDYTAVNKPMVDWNNVGDCSTINLNHYQPVVNNFGFGPFLGFHGFQGSDVGFWTPFTDAQIPRAEPPYRINSNTDALFRADWEHLRQVYSRLNDTMKGLGSLIGGHGHINKIVEVEDHWGYAQPLTIAVSILNNTNLSYKLNTKLMLGIFASYYEGNIAELTNKRFYDTIRPPTAMQCLYENTTITSWAGPYQGVQPLTSGRKWLAYLTTGYANNLSPEYACGHCVEFAATLKTAEFILGNTRWPGTTYTTPAGSFAPEPKITVGQPGYIAGVTDVPNTGYNTVGYSPAHDITFRFNTIEDFIGIVGDAREYLGFHTRHSGAAGTALGRKVSKNVVNYLSKNLFTRNGHCKSL